MEDGRKLKLRKETGIVAEVLPSPLASGFGAAATIGRVWLTPLVVIPAATVNNLSELLSLCVNYSKFRAWKGTR